MALSNVSPLLDTKVLRAAPGILCPYGFHRVWHSGWPLVGSQKLICTCCPTLGQAPGTSPSPVLPLTGLLSQAHLESTGQLLPGAGQCSQDGRGGGADVGAQCEWVGALKADHTQAWG